MSDDDISIQIPKHVRDSILLSIVAIVLLSVGAIAAFRYGKLRPSTIVLPAGITYLGPSISPAPVPSTQQNKIPISPSDEWMTRKGVIYPYAFSFPKSLSLGVFPNDAFDSVTIIWGDTNSQENLLLRVEDLSKDEKLKTYVSKPKSEYAKEWWRQYNWSGLESVTQFTNSFGLRGYRAKYLDNTGTVPYDNIFFEVPGHSNLVIWMSGKLLDQTTFDKLIDSVAYGN